MAISAPEQTTVTPVSEGGTPLNIHSGAEALGSLGLFDDDPIESSAPEHDDAGEKENPDVTASKGNQDIDDPGTDDEQTASEDTDIDASNSEDAPQGEDDQAPTLETLDDLIEYMETDSETIGNLTTTFNADGEQVTVSLSELQRGYHQQANYTRQKQELAQQSQLYEQQHQERMQAHEREMVITGNVLQEVKSIFEAQLQSPAMQQLRVNNPAEWSARREELGQIINGIQQAYAQTSNRFDAHQKQQQADIRAKMADFAIKETDNLLTAMPDWSEESSLKLRSYLTSDYGYSDNDVNNIYDSRVIRIAEKARKYDEMQKVGKETKKKIKRLPKVAKASKANSESSQSRKQKSRISAARKQLKSTGKLRDAANLIGEFYSED